MNLPLLPGTRRVTRADSAPRTRRRLSPPGGAGHLGLPTYLARHAAAQDRGVFTPNLIRR